MTVVDLVKLDIDIGNEELDLGGPEESYRYRIDYYYLLLSLDKYTMVWIYFTCESKHVYSVRNQIVYYSKNRYKHQGFKLESHSTILSDGRVKFAVRKVGDVIKG